MRTLTADQARRIALAAQGFADARPSGRVDVRHLRRVLDRVGLLQIDSVNVVVRAHYMPPFSRLGPYRMGLLDDMAYRRRELYEYWGHVASLIPVEHYPLFRHRMELAEPGRQTGGVMEEHPGYIEAVLAEVGARGPVSISDLEDPGARSGPWWGHGKGKTALEWLFTTGRLAIADRRNFTRHYDLPERVLPAHLLNGSFPAAADARRRLLAMSAEHLGVATAADLVDYYRIPIGDGRRLVAELAAEGALDEVRVEGWREPGFTVPGARVPRRVAAQALLSPFDSLIWFRERTERLFGFHYRIEIYVPAPKRIYGYYVYPFLLGDRLVGRIDLKADRAAGLLLAPGAFAEDGEDRGRVAAALAEELRSMAGWLGLAGVRVGRKGNLAGELRSAIR